MTPQSSVGSGGEAGRFDVPVRGSRPWVMGILNVTPDSFSDGGRWDSTAAAIVRGRELVADGADLVDVGGESTRPGAHRVSPADELARVVPVIRELAAEGVQCSVDTTRSSVAAAAVAAGAVIINDVSGGLADPEMASVAAETKAPWILMHWRGHSDRMADLAHYQDVTREVVDELLGQVHAAVDAGVDRSAIILDPGLGFAKNGDHNLVLLRSLPAIVELGFPVLVGASRKRFLGELLADANGTPRPPSGREAATAALSVLVGQQGAWGVRVHEPRPTRDAFAAWEAVRTDSAEGFEPSPLARRPRVEGPTTDSTTGATR